MDDFFGTILGVGIAIGIVVGIIYLIITYVVPVLLTVGAAVLFVAAGVGVILGAVVALKNYIEAISDVVYERKSLDGYKNEALKKMHESDKERGSVSFFEVYGAKSYLFGPCFVDVFTIILYAFLNNYDNMPEFGRGENAFTKVFFFILTLFQIIVTFVLGTIVTLAFSVILLALFLTFWIIACFFSLIVLFFEKLYFSSRQISYRCPVDKYSFKVPVYECPKCGIRHGKLKPGFYGLFRRKCLCGCRLPVTARGTGYLYEYQKMQNGLTRYVKLKIKLNNLYSYCPKCNAECNAGLSKPTSIALIGGKAAGKSTFKTAFLHDLFEDELVKMDIGYDFPYEDLESEYADIRQYYTGRRIIPATNRGTLNDISTFSFSLSHKKFSADRMIHLYDMPGEVFESGEAKEGWENYSFTEGAVFLLDPYSIPAVRNRKEVAEANMAICEMKMNNLAESLVSTLEQVKVGKRKGKFTIPIALAITKVDSYFLRGMCGTDAVLSLMKNKPEVFNDYFLTVDYACRSFLSRNGGDNFISILDQHFETVHYFFCSPMGYVPKSTRTRFSPINIMPIMQWMMLRADKQLCRAWKPDIPVIDLTTEQKQLYMQYPEYYDEYVQGVFVDSN